MNWIIEAKRIFNVPKPEHFTNFTHCEECAEHDKTLLNNNIDSIGLDELGNVGWDPMCFSSEEGKKYYMPALVRLTIDTMSKEFYLGQFLFHLELNGTDNNLVQNCDTEQREFIASFIKYLIENNTKEIEDNYYSEDILRVYEIWSKYHA